MRLAQAKDVTKLVKTGVRLLVNEMGAARAAVILGEPGQTEPPVAAAYGLDGEALWADRTVPLDLIRYVMERRTTVVVKDPEVNKKYCSDTCGQGSIVCAPIHKNRQVVGALYGDHPDSGVFDDESANRLSREATEFSLRYFQLTSPEPEEPDPPAPQEIEEEEVQRALRLPKALVAGVLVLGLGLTFWLTPPAQPAERPQPEVTSRADPSAREHLDRALAALNSRDREQLESLIAPELKGQIGSEKLQGWLNSQPETRRLDRFQVRGRQATARLNLPGQPRDRAWTWTLSRRGQGWLLTDLGGNPLP